MADLTPQQRLAVEHRASSVVLASGAGCGKTHVLTARYLSHLADDAAEVSQVVAITFTERAAREMRDRIRGAVQRQLTAAPSADAGRWQRHLRGLETAPVATIHGFCGTLLRQHAVAAALDPRFEILDDVLAANLRTEARLTCLYGLLEADPASQPAADLRELVVLFGWPAVVEAVEELLTDPDPRAWADWLARSPDDIAAGWLGTDRAALLPGWVAYLAAASTKVAPALAALERVSGCTAELAKLVRRITDGFAGLASAKDVGAAVEELAGLAKVQGTKKKDWGDDEQYEAVKKAFADLRAELPRRFALFADDPAGAADAARVGQMVLRVATAAADEYRRRKRRAGALDFHDLLVLARDLVRDRPDVRDDLRRRFRFVLLDELQDTDPVQMELVELLCGGGLTGGKLFAVGDHKQSIYRFRGAEVGLFQNLRTQVPADGRLGLTRNYRSQPDVLRFVNALFRQRVPDYEPLESHHAAAGAEPNVEFLWAVPAADADETALDVRKREADAIARRVAELLDDPAPRVLARDGSVRRPRAGDVVLLFRSMSHVAAYEAALRRQGLDYYLVGGRAFFAQQEVYDLLNLLRAVENPQDSTSLVGVLRSPFCGLSDEAVVLLATHPDGPWAALFDPERVDALPADQRPHADRARRHLGRWRSLKDKLPIARLLNAVFADSGYDAATQFEFLGDRKLANLWKLLDLARDFDRGGRFGLHEFTARLGDLVARQPREEQAATLPESADVVRLMSIHQAKGLEFPVVVVPDLAAPARGDRHPVARWHRGLGCLVRLPAEFEDADDAADRPFSDFADRLGRTADQLADWQEDLRVLYVACTRARDLLVLSAGLPAPLGADPLRRLPPKAANHWTLALAERFDLASGRCVDPAAAPRVRVTVVEPGPDVVLESKPACEEDDARTPTHGRARALPAVPPFPAIVSLPALERAARGEPVATLAEHFDTEDDSDRPHWRTLRDRLGDPSAADAALWAVLDRWPFADVDAWAQLLSDALEDVPDPADARRAADALRPRLRAFAESEARRRLASAAEVRRGVEFLADLRGLDESAADLPAVRGVIDFLYRDAAGWHVLALDPGTAAEDDPWRGRRPGLQLQAWAVFRQTGDWPATVGLFDLGTGQFLEADPRRTRPATIAAHFARHLTDWAGA